MIPKPNPASVAADANLRVREDVRVQRGITTDGWYYVIVITDAFADVMVEGILSYTLIPAALATWLMANADDLTTMEIRSYLDASI